MIKYVITTILLLYCGQVFSQSHPDSTGYFKSYFTNTRDVIVSPFKWDKTDLANLTLVSGTTAFLFIYDEKLDDFINRNQHRGIENFSRNLVSPFGNGMYSLPLIGVVYLAGAITKNNYDKEMALLALKTFVISAGESTIIKMAIQRNRPMDNHPPDAWQFDGPFNKFSDNGSFISRHAATSFAIATVFAEGYGSRKKWVPVVAYSLASLVTISRVYEREHWASDAFAGACVGFVTGKFMYKINQKKNAAYKKP